MTGQDIQDRLDAIVKDLQTTAKGKSTQIAFRNSGGVLEIYTLSSDANGVVNAAQLATIQGELDAIKAIADQYTDDFAPVKAASETFRTAREVHRTLIDASTAAREALNDALKNDANYQAAETALKTAQQNVDYINSRTLYLESHVSEIYGNLSDAKGKYI